MNANGTIHRIGGSDRGSHHAIWCKSHGHWEPSKGIFQFARDYLSKPSLIYVKSKNIILMLGGSHWDTVRGPNGIGMWRFDIATSTWKHIFDDESKEYRYSNTHAVLTSDEQNVIIVRWNRIEILNIQDENDYKVTASMEIPHGNEYWTGYPVLMKCRATEVFMLTSGWFRKLFKSKDDGAVACPLDILKLIDQFVCEQMLHLIKWKRASAKEHLAFHLTDVLSSDSGETPSPLQLPGLYL